MKIVDGVDLGDDSDNAFVGAFAVVLVDVGWDDDDLFERAKWLCLN